MQTSLTVAQLAPLTALLVVGALVPGVSVLTVSARAADGGFTHGAAVAAGVVAGDLLFILIAIYGLSLLAGWLGDDFVLVRYLGGAYLIGLGVALWRAQRTHAGGDAGRPISLPGSFLLGLAVTLGDQKAILFYLALLPGLLELAALTWLDTAVILLVATIAVGVPKLAYAYGAARGIRHLRDRVGAGLVRGLASIVLVTVGLYLLLAPSL